mgnify:CR=1 FL=1
MKAPAVVFIFGPTGVGKTELAVQAADGIGEIESVDSMQVYRELDLGTAKPSPEQRDRVPHHLVDVVRPARRFSAGDFKRMALRAVERIAGRGKVPVLVGGTGLYFRALEYNLPNAPPADARLRDELYRREEAEPGVLHRTLQSMDPETARTLHPRDLVRLVRAIEIQRLSGVRFSELARRAPSKLVRPIKIGVILERERLYRRLELRCRRMIAAGLPAEVAELVRKGYREDLPAMKGLGYSHFIQYFKGCRGREEIERLFARDTRRYAKRQLTWFRKEQGVRWLGPDQTEEARAVIRSVYQG